MTTTTISYDDYIADCCSITLSQNKTKWNYLKFQVMSIENKITNLEQIINDLKSKEEEDAQQQQQQLMFNYIKEWDFSKKMDTIYLLDMKSIEYDITKKLFEFNHQCHNSYSLQKIGILHLPETTWKEDGKIADSGHSSSFELKISSMWKNKNRMNEFIEKSPVIIENARIAYEREINKNNNQDIKRCEECHINIPSLFVSEDKNVCFTTEKTSSCVCCIATTDNNVSLYPFCSQCLLKQFTTKWKENYNSIVDESDINSNNITSLIKNKNRCSTLITCSSCRGELCCFQIIDFKQTRNQQQQQQQSFMSNEDVNFWDKIIPVQSTQQQQQPTGNTVDNIVEILKRLEDRLTINSPIPQQRFAYVNNNNNTALPPPVKKLRMSSDESITNGNSIGKIRHCGNCGQDGHYYKKCPDQEGAAYHKSLKEEKKQKRLLYSNNNNNSNNQQDMSSPPLQQQQQQQQQPPPPVQQQQRYYENEEE